MKTSPECRLAAGVNADLYLFADEANRERDNLIRENQRLLEVVAELTVKCDRLNAALDRAITVMAHMEKRHAQILADI